jgi:hypothetical protein
MTSHRIAVIAALVTLTAASATAQPGAATLISPSSDVNSTTIAFTWQSAPTATWYHFWLGKADTSLVMEHWYTAEHAGCASGGTCAITVTPPVTAGAYIWHIRTWSGAGYGPWSPAHLFTVREVVQAWSGTLPPSRRFTVVLNGQAVLDNETGLVWQRNAGAFTPKRWSSVQIDCVLAYIGGRSGWRVPSIAELKSLIEPTANTPALPVGHPFLLPAERNYWSQTQLTGSGTYWVVSIDSGNAGSSPDDAAILYRTWCVRGGTASQ